MCACARLLERFFDSFAIAGPPMPGSTIAVASAAAGRT
jgi:hypothetical protein